MKKKALILFHSLCIAHLQRIRWTGRQEEKIVRLEEDFTRLVKFPVNPLYLYCIVFMSNQQMYSKQT